MARNATAPKSSRKFVKAAVVTGAGIALLAAGGATFATWSDTATVKGADIASGALQLHEKSDGVWKNSRSTVIDPATYNVIPGDVLTYTETVQIEAAGTIIDATLKTNLGTPAVTGDADLAAAIVPASTFTVDGTEYDALEKKITEANDGNVVTVQLTVPFSDQVTGTTAQNQKVNLSALEIQLNQNPVNPVG